MRLLENKSRIPLLLAIVAALGAGLGVILTLVWGKRRRFGAEPEGDDLSWRGAWNRPLKLDRKSLDPLTAARMTDHNVR